jgi:ribonuclease J
MATQVTVFDGANCIGGSKIHLLDNDVGFFLDFGMNFGSYSRYFEEFVQPRTARGIHDLWVLNLIPHLKGIYRKDIFPADLDASGAQSIKVDAVFVSHAHLDHSGNVGLLEPTIPIYASGMTAIIAKAMQDCGKVSFEGEIAYISPRTVSSVDTRAICAVKGKDASCQSRSVRLVDRHVDLEKFNDFWSQTFSTKKIECIPLSSANDKIESINFKAFPVDHSIFGAIAYAFETPVGWVAYSGDLRLHGTRGYLTEKFIEELAKLKPHALIIEGTNILEEKGATEDEVYVNCLRAAQEAKGKLIIADFGPRNIERLETFLRIAKDVNRKLLVTAKDAFLLYAMRLADESLPDVLGDPNLGIYDEIKASMNKWEKDFIRANYAEKYVSANDIAQNQASFIMEIGRAHV